MTLPNFFWASSVFSTGSESGLRRVVGLQMRNSRNSSDTSKMAEEAFFYRRPRRNIDPDSPAQTRVPWWVSGSPAQRFRDASGARDPRLDTPKAAKQFHSAPPQGDTALSRERFTWPTISPTVGGERVVSGYLVSPAVRVPAKVSTSLSPHSGYRGDLCGLGAGRGWTQSSQGLKPSKAHVSYLALCRRREAAHQQASGCSLSLEPPNGPWLLSNAPSTSPTRPPRHGWLPAHADGESKPLQTATEHVQEASPTPWNSESTHTRTLEHLRGQSWTSRQEALSAWRQASWDHEKMYHLKNSPPKANET